mgnify:CR=1 FL=1
MLPLLLAWAWTIWKSQGQTILTKIVMNLGANEKEHGLSYVAFSRATKLSNIGITGGMAGNCLTTTVKKMKNRLEEDNSLNILQIATNNKLNNMRTT